MMSLWKLLKSRHDCRSVLPENSTTFRSNCSRCSHILNFALFHEGGVSLPHCAVVCKMTERRESRVFFFICLLLIGQLYYQLIFQSY